MMLLQQVRHERKQALVQVYFEVVIQVVVMRTWVVVDSLAKQGVMGCWNC